jgi:hypothetical protein
MMENGYDGDKTRKVSGNVKAAFPMLETTDMFFLWIPQ